MNGMRSIILGLAVLLLAGCASAGFTMNLKTTSEVLSGEEVRINFTLSNTGNEVAYQVWLEPMLPEGFESSSFRLLKLPPGIPLNSSLKIKMPVGTLPGRYSVGLKLHYRDVNGYPLSVVFPESIAFQNSTASEVVISLPMTEITGSTPVDFDIKLFNQKPNSRNITVRLYLPDELGVDTVMRNVEIDGNSGLTLEGSIWSVSALYDSDYLVIGSVSYTDGGMSYSYTSLNRVKVVKPSILRVGSNIFMETKWVLTAFIVVVVIVLLYMTMREKHKTKNEGKEFKKERKERK